MDTSPPKSPTFLLPENENPKNIGPVPEESALNRTTANPAAKADLDALIKHSENGIAGKVWRGSQKNSPKKNKHLGALSSGYTQFDQLLHQGGWPLDTCTEIGISEPGIGELRLLIPALRALQQSQQKNIVFIAPPLLPNAPALVKEKIDISQLTIVQTTTLADTLWAAEQALLSACCAAVFSWVGNADLGNKTLRRLQLAAEKNHSWNVLFRHSDCLKQSSAAGLRINLKTNSYSQLDIKVIKQPQGWAGQKCTLSLHPHYEQWQRLPAHLLPHHNKAQTPNIPVELSTLNDYEQCPASVTVLAPLSSIELVH